MACLHEAFRGVELDKAAAVQQHDPVSVRDGVQAVGNRENCALPKSAPNRGLPNAQDNIVEGSPLCNFTSRATHSIPGRQLSRKLHISECLCSKCLTQRHSFCARTIDSKRGFQYTRHLCENKTKKIPDVSSATQWIKP